MKLGGSYTGWRISHFWEMNGQFNEVMKSLIQGSGLNECWKDGLINIHYLQNSTEHIYIIK